MSCRYAVGNDRCQYESYTHSYGLGNGQCSPSEAIVERLTVEKLHDEERLVVVLFDTVELANVRVANLRRRARFAPKPFLRALVLL